MIAKIKKAVSYFTAAEIILWAVSVLLITSSFFIFARREYLTLAASLVGVTALIFCAKGNPAGQALMILFSAMYGVISFTFAYYGEMNDDLPRNVRADGGLFAGVVAPQSV